MMSLREIIWWYVLGGCLWGVYSIAHWAVRQRAGRQLGWKPVFPRRGELLATIIIQAMVWPVVAAITYWLMLKDMAQGYEEMGTYYYRKYWEDKGYL
jgi:hypothetical protein